MTSKAAQRINRFIIRVMGLIIAGVIGITFFLFLMDLQGGLFYSGGEPSPFLPFDYTILARQIGSYLWTFRVYDMMLLLVIMLLTIICGYYLVSFKSAIAVESKRRREVR